MCILLAIVLSLVQSVKEIMICRHTDETTSNTPSMDDNRQLVLWNS